jgi:hypothetical protein
MGQSYRNYNAPNRAQKVSITWSMETPEDDCTDGPDERQDGFWPSHDPKAAGYCPADKFEALQRECENLMKGFVRGDWSYVGVVAVARISIPIGGGSFITHTLRSPGLWGIESYSPEYHKEVYEEQKTELLEQLKILAAAIQSDAP